MSSAGHHGFPEPDLGAGLFIILGVVWRSSSVDVSE